MSSYLERPVHPSLADAVVCTWLDRASHRRYPVLPDGCIDIVWDSQHLWVAGPDTGPSQVNGEATYAGIRFKPGAAPGFLGVAASELVDRSVSLVDLWNRDADQLAERLAEAPSSAPRLLEDALRARQGLRAELDPLVGDLVRQLGRARPGPASAARIKRLARKLDVSERTLRRRCISAIGYGPKTLDRILRFRRALRLIRARAPLIEAAQLAGYVDQAHLTHEFQRLAGSPPGELSNLSEIIVSSNGCA